MGNNMKGYIEHFGQPVSNQELISEIEEIKTRATSMVGFGLLLAFSTLALVLKSRG